MPADHAQIFTGLASKLVAEARSTWFDPGANVAWLLCDRHDPSSVAFTFVDERLAGRDVTFGELRDLSLRYAAGLRSLGVGRGDRVATLLGKGPELVAVMLATWRLGAVYVPLFTAFGPGAIAPRLAGCAARVVVVDAGQRDKLRPGPDMPSRAPWRIVVNADAPRGDVRLRDLGRGPQPDDLAGSVAVGGDGALVHLFTSGTTGSPKGIVHRVAFMADWDVYLTFALALTGDDVYWCAADPGWGYGLFSAVIGPMSLGIRSLLLTGGFDVARTWRVLETFGVTNFAAAPTAFRALRASAEKIPSRLQLARLSSAGEPLTPEVSGWAASVLGVPILDHYGQTEIGMAVASQHHPEDARPLVAGSIGYPMPGWAVDVLREDAGQPASDGVHGRLAVDVAASPLMTFDGYHDAGAGRDGFTADGRWYLTGDLAWRDHIGALHYVARGDDVIITAGYRVGPADIESTLNQHPAVAESAVIAAPDERRGQVIEAFVVLRAGTEPGPELEHDLQALVKERLAAHAYPRRVHFRAELPKTPSGKIQRFTLRAECRPAM